MARLQSWDSKSETSPLLGFTVDQTNIKAEVSQILAIMGEYRNDLGNGVIAWDDVKDTVIENLYAAGLQKVIDEVQIGRASCRERV